MSSVIVGSFVGLLTAVTLYSVRRFVWPLSQAIGLISGLCLGVGAIAWFLISISALGKGGDGAIAGMTGLIGLVAGLMLIFVVPLLVSLSQAPRLRRPFIWIVMTLFVEPAIIAVAIWMFQSSVTSPSQRANTDEWWKKESARRNRIEQLKNDIPLKYREWNQQLLDLDAFNRKEIAKHGGYVKPAVPPEIESKLHAYWAAASEPEVPANLSIYTDAQQDLNRFSWAAILAWFLAALIFPWVVVPAGAIQASESSHGNPVP